MSHSPPPKSVKYAIPGGIMYFTLPPPPKVFFFAYQSTPCKGQEGEGDMRRAVSDAHGLLMAATGCLARRLMAWHPSLSCRPTWAAFSKPRPNHFRRALRHCNSVSKTRPPNWTTNSEGNSSMWPKWVHRQRQQRPCHMPLKSLLKKSTRGDGLHATGEEKPRHTQSGKPQMSK